MNFKFKPDDFDDIPIGDTWDTSIVADRANRILTERGVRVYGKHVPTISDEVSKENDIPLCWHWSNKQQQVSKEHPGSHETHQALLVCIEEIKKACEHEPSLYIRHGFYALGCEIKKQEWRCVKCGIALKWSPA